jgi:hypothetical protein
VEGDAVTVKVKPNFSILGDDGPLAVALPVEGVSKRCSKCGEVKPSDAFGRKMQASNGLRPMCRPCDRAYSRSRHARALAADPEGFRARKAAAAARFETARRAADPEGVRARRAAAERARRAADPGFKARAAAAERARRAAKKAANAA